MIWRLFTLRRRPATAPAEPPPATPDWPPQAANANVPVIGLDVDPEDALERVRAGLAYLRQENEETGRLLSCPQRRRDYEEGLALEQQILMRYFEWAADEA